MLKELVSMMVKHDLKEAEKELHLKNGGYEVKNYYEQGNQPLMNADKHRWDNGRLASKL